ncbi:MAG: hypothetical protein QXM27_01810 [Candidatus Pacearchaeota archaeon]
MGVYISKKALKRSIRDSFIRGKISEYLDEIRLIVYSKGKRPTERIKEFNVSPRGHKKIRIAWHIEGDNFYIDDFLYHETDKYYVDKWNKKVLTGEITLETYRKEGYIELPLNKLDTINVEEYNKLCYSILT